MSLPVTVHEILPVREIIITPDGEKVLDIGQEFTGIFRLHVKYQPVQRCIFRQGRSCRAGISTETTCVLPDPNISIFPTGRNVNWNQNSRSTAYRYVKVDGIPILKDFTGLALYSRIGEVGRAETERPGQSAAVQHSMGTQEQFLDVPTDCP